MNYFSLPILAIAPSLIWLFVYLRKDLHPEAKRMIAKVFLYGMLATLPAYFIERGIQLKLSSLLISPFTASLIYFFIVVGITEEICKYFAAKLGSFSSSELDEPIDVIEYMIIAALGFAALENVFYLIPQNDPDLSPLVGVVVAIQRFIGATLLHALASGAFGYFLMLSFANPKREIPLTLTGLFLASFLHGLFNFSIIQAEETYDYRKLFIPVGILAGLAIFVSWGIKKAKKMKAVCE